MFGSAAARQAAGPAPSWFNVGTMGLAHFTSDFYCNLLPALLPLLAVRFDLSYSQCATVFMVFSVTTNFIQPPVGMWADRARINVLMPLSVLTGGVFACALGWCDSLAAVIVVTLIAGVCASGFHPIAGGIMPQLSTPRHQVLATSIFIAGGNVGFAVGPALTALYLERFALDDLIYLAVPAVLVTALIWARRLHVQPRRGAPRHVPNFRELLRNRDFISLSVSVGLRSWCYCALVIFLPLLLVGRGYSNVESSTALMVTLLGTVAGGLMAGGLSVRFTLKQIIIGTYVITLLAFAAFIVSPALTWPAYTALFVCGIGMYGSTPAAIVWAQRLLDKSAALAASMMLGFTFGLGYVASVLTGYVADFIGLQWALAVTLLPSMALAVVVLAPLREPPAVKPLPIP